MRLWIVGRNLFSVSDHKQNTILATHTLILSQSLTHEDKAHVGALGKLLRSTCAVDMNIPPREEPKGSCVFRHDQDKVVSVDGFVLQQMGDSLHSPSDLLPPPLVPGRSMDDSFLIPFRSVYGI